MYILIILIILAFTAYTKLKMPEWKGKYSEKRVERIISRLSSEYVIYNNLLVKNRGHSTQIDHLIISPYGLFVIETKGYKGWIFGSENSEYWTQTIYKNKYKFFNPIKQNDAHIKALQILLKNLRNVPFVPIVVFNNSATLNVRSENYDVINICDLKRVILQYKERLLSEVTINKIVDIINCINDSITEIDTRQHKQYVKRRQYRRQSLIDQGLCPHCGGKLILRDGKYGLFYGCSNFPKCRTIINLK